MAKKNPTDLTGAPVPTDLAGVGVRVIQRSRRADTSRQMDDRDPFHNGADLAGFVYISPPYEPRYLAQLRTHSSIIPQCIDAYVTNIAGCGYEVTPVDEKRKTLAAETAELRSFIANANSEQSLSSVMALVVDDYETYGYGFMEVIRDRKGRVSFLRHIRAHTVRLGTLSEKTIPVTFTIRRGGRNTDVVEHRRFRRYIQIINGETRYFREFGDHRQMDYIDGQYSQSVSLDRQATEIIHFRQNSTDPYGIPRWIAQLPNILGTREAEECNYRYFEDNTIPPMMVTVSGGRLTNQSFRNLNNVLSGAGLGKERQHKAVLLEAIADGDSLDAKGTVNIRVDKLADTRQGDGLFKGYDDGNQAKMLSCFRLPPIVVGMSQDHNFATANVSQFLAEMQVFKPARARFDEQLNKKLINGPFGLGLGTVQLTSMVPTITNSEGLIKSLTALNVMGAITPRIANEAANKLLQIDISAYPQPGEDGYEEWMDKPIVFVTRGTASQDGQATKDAGTKQVEDTGDVSTKAPPHGQE